MIGGIFNLALGYGINLIFVIFVCRLVYDLVIAPHLILVLTLAGLALVAIVVGAVVRDRRINGWRAWQRNLLPGWELAADGSIVRSRRS